MKIDMNDVESVAETSLTIRGSRRRTTVPKVIVEKLGLADHDKVRWILFRNGDICIARVGRGNGDCSG